MHKLILEYTLHGGDPAWLKGLGYAPAKLRSLSHINKLMAHRPWAIDRSHIESLTHGSDPWSVSELFHALVILAHFHSLSSFIYGCGINPELDHPEAAFVTHRNDSPSSNSSNCDSCHSHSSSPHQSGGSRSAISEINDNTNKVSPGNDQHQELIQVVLERMRLLTESSQNDMEELNEEEVASKFQEVEAAAADIQPSVQSPLSLAIGRCPVVMRFLSSSTGSQNQSPSDDSNSPLTYTDFFTRRGSVSQSSNPNAGPSPMKAQVSI